MILVMTLKLNHPKKQKFKIILLKKLDIYFFLLRIYL